MNQHRRILLGLLVLLGLSGLVLGGEALRAASEARRTPPELSPGDIPLYYGGRLAGGFTPQDLEALEQVSFVDAEDGKTQEGWLLRDVLLLHLKRTQFNGETQVTVISSSRDKQVTMSWAEVADTDNMIMFDLSGRGTLKLVSLLERLDTRDEWVQDVDRIEVVQP